MAVGGWQGRDVKVAKLVELLKTMPQDADVFWASPDPWEHGPVEVVTFNEPVEEREKFLDDGSPIVWLQ